jgi:uracil DNA glycosylase
MSGFRMIRPDVSQLTVAEMSEQYPPPGWEKVFQAAKPELNLASHLLQQLEPYFPPKEKLFNALDLCPLSNVKVVILGQDPYHTTCNGCPHANGMAFSSDRGTDVRPSLKNIYKELEKEYGEQTIYEMSNQYMENRNYLLKYYKPEYYGANPNPNERSVNAIYFEGEMVAHDNLGPLSPSQYELLVNAPLRKQSNMSHEQLVAFRQLNDREIVEYVRRTIPVFKAPNHGDLSKWAEQGVLLLNTCLTVAPHQAGSHKQMWNGVIRRILDAINDTNPECVYLLWGAPARKVGEKLSQKAIKLFASHPSPLSATRKSRDIPAFIGCGHFRKVNQYLKQQGKEQIDWFLN